MPDSLPASASGVPRIAGLVLAVAGAVGLVVAAFLTWFTVTPDLTKLFGVNLDVHAEVSGIGSVSFAATGPAAGAIEREGSQVVSTEAAWAGWAVIVLGVGVAVAAALAAFGPTRARRAPAVAAAASALAGAGVAMYALIVPTGSETTRVAGSELTVTTASGPGPLVALAAAVVATLGAIGLFLARRSAPVAVAQPAPQAPHPPASPFLAGGQPNVAQPPAAAPGGPMPGAPMTPGVPAYAPQAPSNQHFPPADPGWARPVPPMPATTPPPPPASTPPPPPASVDQTRTAVSPVAQRRPQPDWDRNWPGAVPPKPGPLTPSEQHTQVVKRPPRPVKVSPKPETEAIPRRDPRFDSPTQP